MDSPFHGNQQNDSLVSCVLQHGYENALSNVGKAASRSLDAVLFKLHDSLESIQNKSCNS